MALRGPRGPRRPPDHPGRDKGFDGGGARHGRSWHSSPSGRTHDGSISRPRRPRCGLRRRGGRGPPPLALLLVALILGVEVGVMASGGTQTRNLLDFDDSLAGRLRFWDGLRRIDATGSDEYGGGGSLDPRTRSGSSVVEVTVVPPAAGTDPAANDTTATVVAPNAPSASISIRGGRYRLCNLVSLLPATNGEGEPQRDFGLETTGAAILAISHFNDRDSSIVPEMSTEVVSGGGCNVKFTADFLNTRFSERVASDLTLKVLHERNHSLSTPLPTAILGAVRSAVTSPVSILASVSTTPVVSFASTSSLLDNKDVYPYFGRTTPTSAGTAYAAVSYLSDVLDVRHCAVLFVRDDWGQSYMSDFERAAREHDPPIRLVAASYDADGDRTGNVESIREALGILKNAGHNYVFGITSSVTLLRVMGVARDLGMAGAGSGRHWVLERIVQSNLDGAMGDEALTDALRGAVAMRFSVRPTREFVRAWRTLEDDLELKRYFVEKQPNDVNLTGFKFRSRPSIRELFHYDAVMALGLAACDIETSSREEDWVEGNEPDDSGEENGGGSDNDDDDDGDVDVDYFFDGPTLLRRLRNLSFVGASGPVRFDNVTGTRDFTGIPYKVVNVVEEDGANGTRRGMQAVAGGAGGGGTSSPPALVVVDVARQDILNMSDGGEGGGSTPYGWVIIRPTVYSNGGTVPPSDLPAADETFYTISTTALVIGLTLGAIVMASSLGWAVWTVVHWRSRIVQVSQPEFLLMLCAGTFVMACTVIPLSLQEPIQEVGMVGACMAVPWLFFVGFVISFSALFSKTLRMHMLFKESQKFRRIRLRPKDMILPFVILLSCTVILLVSWTVVAPLRWTHVHGISVDSYGRSLESWGICGAEDDVALAFVCLLVAVYLCCIVFALYVCYVARHVHSDYNETSYICISVASILQTMAIAVPVLVAAFGLPTAHFVVTTLCIVLYTAAIQVPIFLAKVHALKNEEEQKRLKALLKKERGIHHELAIKNFDLKHELTALRSPDARTSNVSTRSRSAADITADCSRSMIFAEHDHFQTMMTLTLDDDIG